MVQLMLGVFAFVLYFVGDYNDWKLSCPLLRLCFPVGCVVMIAATFWELISGCEIRSLLPIIPAVFFLFLLIYTLFFALPAEDAYVSQESGRKVCDTGMYSLCRHPGVLCYFGLYLSLYFIGIINIWSLIVFNFLNLMLVVFEDKCVFVTNMEGYKEYQERVPFLIPGTKKKSTVQRKVLLENS